MPSRRFNGDGGLTIEPPPPTAGWVQVARRPRQARVEGAGTPSARYNTVNTIVVCAGGRVRPTREMYSNFSPEYTRAREVGKDTYVVVSEKTLQAPFETKLQLPSGIAAVFAGMMRSKTVVELLARTGLRKHAAGTRTSSRS